MQRVWWEYRCAEPKSAWMLRKYLTQTGFLGGTMLVDWALNDFSVQDQPEQRQQCIKGTNWGR